MTLGLAKTQGKRLRWQMVKPRLGLAGGVLFKANCQGGLVEDITIRVTRPGGAGLRHDDHPMKPNIKLEDGGSVMGLRPRGGLRPVVINRR